MDEPVINEPEVIAAIAELENRFGAAGTTWPQMREAVDELAIAIARAMLHLGARALLEAAEDIIIWDREEGVADGR